MHLDPAPAGGPGQRAVRRSVVLFLAAYYHYQGKIRFPLVDEGVFC